MNPTTDKLWSSPLPRRASTRATDGLVPIVWQQAVSARFRPRLALHGQQRTGSAWECVRRTGGEVMSEKALRELLAEAADYTRHPDYDWPVEFSRRVSEALAQPAQADERDRELEAMKERAERAERERDEALALLREARGMWVDDHSNLAARIDALLEGK